jgi:hypothetical protein
MLIKELQCLLASLEGYVNNVSLRLRQSFLCSVKVGI